MKSDRRRFLQASAGSVALAALPLRLKGASANTVTLGNASLTVVSDGNLVLPGNFVAPPDIPADQFEALVKEHGLNARSYEPACNLSLWQSDDRLVLFDVGSGPNFMPSAGKVLESLEAIDIDPSDITDVVFTHAHPDHLWGLIDDFDEFAFPEARYHMCEVEWDYWADPDTINKLPESRQVFAVGAQSRMAYLEESIQLFKYGQEILPGIEAVDTSGHTPGHTSFALHSGSDSMMVLGDAITHPVISFQKYDWPTGSDQDPVMGQETRKKLLDRMAQDQMQILGFHLPYPGIGYARRKDSAYQFVTA